MAKKYNLLDEIPEEQTETEEAVIPLNDDLNLKIARILQTIQTDKTFNPFVEGEKDTDVLKKYFEEELLTPQIRRESKVLGLFFQKDAFIYDAQNVLQGIKTQRKVAKPEIRPVHEYLYEATPQNLSSFMASQRVIKQFPLVQNFNGRISTYSDLLVAMAYSNMASNTKDRIQKKVLMEIVQDKTLSLREVLAKGVQTVFGQTAPSLQALVGAEEYPPEVLKQLCKELFTNPVMTHYEKAACFMELVNDAKLTRSAFSIDDVVIEFENDRKKYARTEKEIAGLFNGIVRDYHVAIGVPIQKIEVTDKKITTKRKTGEYQVGDKIQMNRHADEEYALTTAGLTGVIEQIRGDGAYEVYFDKLGKPFKVHQRCFDILQEREGKLEKKDPPYQKGDTVRVNKKTDARFKEYRGLEGVLGCNCGTTWKVKFKDTYECIPVENFTHANEDARDEAKQALFEKLTLAGYKRAVEEFAFDLDAKNQKIFGKIQKNHEDKFGYTQNHEKAARIAIIGEVLQRIYD